MAVIQDDQKAQIAFAETDAAGEAVDAPVSFSTDGAVGALGNPVINLTTDADGNSWVEGNDVGTSALTGTATNEDGTIASASITVEVVASDATTLTLTLGAPEPK
ncbi:MAG: hypothetical protein E6J41_33780 [Chloroflexi bacterium]|nr:MAG: hypothetical protein E6J41_33780 [Chloroflexota bacterium]